MKRNALLIVGTVLIVMGGLGIAAANASPGEDHKQSVCHPVEGEGETGFGWNIIPPDKASSHIDESTGAGKHTRKDGDTDVYAVDGKCPGGPTHPGDDPSDSGSPSVTPSVTTTTPPAGDPTPTLPPGDDPSVTPPVGDPTPSVTPSVVPNGPPATPTPTVPPVDDDPVVSTDTDNTPTKVTKTETHKSGKKTVTVTHYPADVVEEGF